MVKTVSIAHGVARKTEHRKPPRLASRHPRNRRNEDVVPNMRFVVAVAFAVVVVAIVFMPALAADIEGVSDRELSEAVSCLRAIDLDALTPRQKTEKSAEIDRAWKTLMDAGTQGRDALVAELEKVERTGEKDDFFKLNATALLWRMTGARDADLIARTWRTVPFETHYWYVFSTAYQAALTQDERVLPILVAFLGDKSGSTSVAMPMHSLTIQWPLGVEFVWGAYGPAGFSVLVEIIEESPDHVMVESALRALTCSGYLHALPGARRLAVQTEIAGIRQAAVRLLGWHGDPQDWELALRGLTSEDSDDVKASLWALCEFDDERGDQYAIPFLDHSDDEVRMEAASALASLCTADALEALLEHEKEMRGFGGVVEKMLSTVGLSPQAFLALRNADRKAVAKEIRALLRGNVPGAARLSRKDALAVVNRWLVEGHVSAESESEILHVLAQSLLPEDIILLQQVRAVMYARVSGQALCDVSGINSVIQQLVRRGFVKIPCPP